MKIHISDMLDGVPDDSVDPRERDIVASERIMEATMKKIQAYETENTPKYRLSRGALTAVIAAAILLALSVTALATGQLWRHIGWDGEEIEQEEPEVTISPDILESFDMAREEEAAEIADQAGKNDLVIIRWENGRGRMGGRSAQIGSLEELRELLAAENSELEIPFKVPEGFELAAGYVYYEAAEGYKYTPISEEERDGFTVKWYAAPEEGNFISSYTLDFEDGSGERLSVYASLMWDGETSFETESGDRVETLTVEGMDKALLIARPNYATLRILKALPEPITYMFVPHLMSNIPEKTEQYTDVIYTLFSASLDADALLEMVSP